MAPWADAPNHVSPAQPVRRRRGGLPRGGASRPGHGRPGTDGEPEGHDRRARPVRHARVQPAERRLPDRSRRAPSGCGTTRRPGRPSRRRRTSSTGRSSTPRWRPPRSQRRQRHPDGARRARPRGRPTTRRRAAPPASSRARPGCPQDLADWDDWVRQVATRYKGRITAYQPWNEANLTTFSTGTPQGDGPAHQARLRHHQERSTRTRRSWRPAPAPGWAVRSRSSTRPTSLS